jgi:hypothetical protein
MSTSKIVPQLIVLAVISIPLPDFAQQTRMNDYSSPKAVYESFRDASQRRDWESYLACLTPAAQKYDLFELFFACAERATDESRRILRTFVDDWNKLHDDYERKKEAKLRAVAAKGDETELKEAQENYNSIHNDLYKDALFDHIPDKIGFHGAARALLKSDLDSVLGEFEKAVVTGDTATGTAKMTMFHLSGGKKVADEGNKEFNFRKIDGKWLIDAP